MPTSTLTLGAFHLRERLERGTLGEVWRGLQTERDLYVVARILTSRHARRRRTRQAFLQDTYVLAGLHHRNLAPIIDFGLLPDDAGALGALPPGSPFVIAEARALSSLALAAPPASWREASAILADLLRGLAHAHAHGITHGDVRPEHIFHAAHASWVLANFGGAFAMSDLRVPAEDSGIFSAQAQARWDQGLPPESLFWRDMRGVGNVARFLVHDISPLRDSEAEPQGISAEEPSFRFTVPPGFSRWLQGFFDRSPRSRFRCAADALIDLLQLTGRTGRAVLPAERVTEAHITPGAASTFSRLRPRVPNTDWRSAALTQPPRYTCLTCVHHPHHAHLHPAPLIGHEQARDAIWGAFRQICNLGTARVVFVEAEAGLGRTRLVRWATALAYEAVGAFWGHIPHDPLDGQSALSAAFSHFFQTHDLSRHDAVQHLRALLHDLGIEDGAWAEPLADALLVRAEQRSGDAPLDEDRYRAFWFFLHAMAHKRPVVLALDDAHWSLDTLRFVEAVLEVQEIHPGRVLLLVTASTNSRACCPEAWTLMDRLRAHPCTTRLTLDPLPGDHQRALLTHLLDLHPDTIEPLCDLTAGSPLFAERLLKEARAKGQLVPSPEGFVLTCPVEELPQHPTDLAVARIALLFDEFGPDAEQALCVGAALQPHAERSVWRRACTLLNVNADVGLLYALRERELLHVSDARWTFTHEELRGWFIEQAKASGRWEAVNRACARALLDTQSPQDAVAAGLHLFAIGDVEEGTGTLLDAMKRAIFDADFGLAIAIWERLDTCFNEQGTPAVARARARAAIMLAELHRWRLSAPSALDAIAQARHIALQLDDRPLLGRIMLAEGRLRLSTVVSTSDPHELEIASALFREAEVIFHDARDPIGSAEIALAFGAMRFNQGAHDPAEQRFQQAFDLLRDGRMLDSAEHQHIVASVEIALAESHRQRGELPQASALCDSAYQRALRVRSRFHANLTRYLHAMIAIEQGDPTFAILRLQAVVEFAERTHSSYVHIFRYGLALALIQAGRHVDAAAVLERILSTFSTQQRLTIALRATCAMMTCAAALRDIGRIDGCIEILGNQANPWLRREERRLLEQAAHLLAQNHQPQRAVRVMRYAIEAAWCCGDLDGAQALYQSMLETAFGVTFSAS